MRIYIMRHGEAASYADSDDARPLTKKGEQESKAMASWLASQIDAPSLDRVLVSPYLRAQQTWSACATSLPAAKQVITEQGITPYGNSDQVASYLRAMIAVESIKTLLVISHLPLVGYLTAEFSPGISPPMFSTSGVACIEFDEKTEKSQLVWIEDPQCLNEKS